MPSLSFIVIEFLFGYFQLVLQDIPPNIWRYFLMNSVAYFRFQYITVRQHFLTMPMIRIAD